MRAAGAGAAGYADADHLRARQIPGPVDHRALACGPTGAAIAGNAQFGRLSARIGRQALGLRAGRGALLPELAFPDGWPETGHDLRPRTRHAERPVRAQAALPGRIEPERSSEVAAHADYHDWRRAILGPQAFRSGPAHRNAHRGRWALRAHRRLSRRRS